MTACCCEDALFHLPQQEYKIWILSIVFTYDLQINSILFLMNTFLIINYEQF